MILGLFIHCSAVPNPVGFRCWQGFESLLCKCLRYSLPVCQPLSSTVSGVLRFLSLLHRTKGLASRSWRLTALTTKVPDKTDLRLFQKNYCEYSMALVLNNHSLVFQAGKEATCLYENLMVAQWSSGKKSNAFFLWH